VYVCKVQGTNNVCARIGISTRTRWVSIKVRLLSSRRLKTTFGALDERLPYPKACEVPTEGTASG